MNLILVIVIAIVALIAGAAGAIVVTRKNAKSQANSIIEKAKLEAEVLKNNEVIKGKEQGLSIKSEAEKQANARLAKVQSSEAKQKQREIQLGQQQQELQRKKDENDKLKINLENQQSVLDERKKEVEKLEMNVRDTLEHVSGLSADEAKEKLVESLKDEAKTAAASYINDIMDDAKMSANKEAKRIIVETIQRVATETAIENAVTVFHIDNDDLKGRIIGREGRNIRALETLTGIDLIIDDTPEAVILSGFDPIRREVARIALEKLIVDGRIHPARIEEMVGKARKEVDQTIKEAGEQATFEADVHGLHPEIVKILGRLKYRTSYGQNVLKHSIEVSHLAGLMAAELGCDVTLAKRGGLIHDIGKALDRELEGSHVQIGVDVARKYRESAAVINCIGAHHGDEEFQTVEAVLVAAADAISAARPGARRETLENYLKRLSKLEEIAESFEGVEKCFAIQAGREIRVVVKPDKIDEAESTLLVRNIVKRIESELEYPGQIKVVIIRETRVVDYAK